MGSEIGIKIKMLYDQGLLPGQIAKEMYIELNQVTGILFSEYGLYAEKHAPKSKKEYSRRSSDDLKLEKLFQESLKDWPKTIKDLVCVE